MMRQLEDAHIRSDKRIAISHSLDHHFYSSVDGGLDEIDRDQVVTRFYKRWNGATEYGEKDGRSGKRRKVSESGK